MCFIKHRFNKKQKSAFCNKVIMRAMEIRPTQAPGKIGDYSAARRDPLGGGVFFGGDGGNAYSFVNT
jgi:hypothetical protein